MNNLINPYDLGEFQLVENSFKININDLLSQTKKELKLSLLHARIDTLGVRIGLTTSKTRFNGDRLWFVCPICTKRVGILYQHSSREMIGCRNCLDMKYRKQRYKGMVEAKI